MCFNPRCIIIIWDIRTKSSASVPVMSGNRRHLFCIYTHLNGKLREAVACTASSDLFQRNSRLLLCLSHWNDSSIDAGWFRLCLLLLFLIRPLGWFVLLIPAPSTNKSTELWHFTPFQNPRMLPHRGDHIVPLARTSMEYYILSVLLYGSTFAFNSAAMCFSYQNNNKKKNPQQL